MLLRKLLYNSKQWGKKISAFYPAPLPPPNVKSVRSIDIKNGINKVEQGKNKVVTLENKHIKHSYRLLSKVRPELLFTNWKKRKESKVEGREREREEKTKSPRNSSFTSSPPTPPPIALKTAEVSLKINSRAITAQPKVPSKSASVKKALKCPVIEISMVYSRAFDNCHEFQLFREGEVWNNFYELPLLA